MNGAVTMTQDKKIWTTSELADHIKVDPSYIRQLLLAKKIKGDKLGPIWVISDEEVERWLNSRRK